jgi:ankyrin repeat protein
MLLRVKLLLATGKADVEVKDENGYTALHHAALNGKLSVVMLLLTMGNAYKGTKSISGKTAERYATEKGHKEVVNLIQSFRAVI